jgi:hypothetical protein
VLARLYRSQHLLRLTIGFHTAHAVPSFARQTGLPYQSCQTVAPEITSIGRNFKLNDFVLTTLPKVESKSGTPLGLSRSTSSNNTLFLPALFDF